MAIEPVYRMFDIVLAGLEEPNRDLVYAWRCTRYSNSVSLHLFKADGAVPVQVPGAVLVLKGVEIEVIVSVEAV